MVRRWLESSLNGQRKSTFEHSEEALPLTVIGRREIHILPKSGTRDAIKALDFWSQSGAVAEGREESQKTRRGERRVGDRSPCFGFLGSAFDGHRGRSEQRACMSWAFWFSAGEFVERLVSRNELLVVLVRFVCLLIKSGHYLPKRLIFNRFWRHYCCRSNRSGVLLASGWISKDEIGLYAFVWFVPWKLFFALIFGFTWRDKKKNNFWPFGSLLFAIWNIFAW